MRYLLTLSLLMAFFSSAQANVSLRNGNYFIGFVDILLPGGLETKIERNFSSKSPYNGWFGFGWMSPLETSVSTSADGAVVVRENGGGAPNRFTAAGKATATDVNRAVEQIWAAKQKEGLAASEASKYKDKLKNDLEFREAEWDRFWARGLVRAPEVPQGTELRSVKFGYQTIIRNKDGFVRNFDNGRVETFNNQGRLVRIVDKNRNYVNLTYGKDGRLAKLEDNYNRRLQFTFNGRGKLTKVQVEGGKSATYEYGNDLLLKSTDSENKTYQFKYSNDGRYNLAEIKYPNGNTIQIAYYPPDKGEGVRFVKETDGSITEYAYTGAPDSLNYSTEVKVKGNDGKVISVNKYEYSEKTKVDGERYIYKMITSVDGEKTETIYNECCGLPLEITRNGEKTTFEYDTKGRVTKKASAAEVTELSYDAKINKISKVVKYSKRSGEAQAQKWASYQYDEKGNLVFAKTSDNRGVRIVYDTNGRIKAMVDQNKRKLEFVYNEQSRPVQIIDAAVGRIDVTYTNAGEIKNVNSTGGRKIASQVTSAFQNLMEIIRPAGVSLSF